MRALPVLVLATALAASGAALAQPATVKPNQPVIGHMQPQGPTGPINTTAGGAPPSSPQGDTPPGMQPDPQIEQQAADPVTSAKAADQKAKRKKQPAHPLPKSP